MPHSATELVDPSRTNPNAAPRTARRVATKGSQLATKGSSSYLFTYRSWRHQSAVAALWAVADGRFRSRLPPGWWAIPLAAINSMRVKRSWAKSNVWARWAIELYPSLGKALLSEQRTWKDYLSFLAWNAVVGGARVASACLGACSIAPRSSVLVVRREFIPRFGTTICRWNAFNVIFHSWKTSIESLTPTRQETDTCRAPEQKRSSSA